MSAYHIQPGEDENWCQSSLIYWYWCTDSLLYRPFIFRLGVYIFNATHCIVVPIRWKAFSSDSVDLNKAAGHLNIRLHLHQLAFASSSWSLLLACHLSKCRRPQVFSLSRSRTSSSDMNTFNSGRWFAKGSCHIFLLQKYKYYVLETEIETEFKSSPIHHKTTQHCWANNSTIYSTITHTTIQ